jgi:hypothetical protein
MVCAFSFATPALDMGHVDAWEFRPDVYLSKIIHDVPLRLRSADRS